MERIISIRPRELPLIKWRGKRVITTSELAAVYGTDTDNIKHNFGNNKEHFTEGYHYYLLKNDELREFKNLVKDIPLVGRRTAQLYLWTHRGASRHCKILDTNEAWEQFDRLEQSYFKQQENYELTGKELVAKALIEASQMLQEKGAEIQSMKPKVIFADAVSASPTSILIGELAKILKQNGVETGEKRLFGWLRQNNYLIRRDGKDYNTPTQRSMEQELFEIKETAITRSTGEIYIKKTSMVTGKGQQYFIRKFLKEREYFVDTI